MNSQERIAKALEEKNEITMGILYGLLCSFIVILAFFLVMGFGQSVYDFFSYDLLGNERPASPVYAIAQSEPIDDCSYSEDKQLCFQMKRIADSLEQQDNNELIINDSLPECSQSEFLMPPTKSNSNWSCWTSNVVYENFE